MTYPISHHSRRWQHRAVFALHGALLVLAAVAPPLVAQCPLRGAVAADSAELSVRARVEGISVAGDRFVAGYFIASFVGGGVAGIAAPLGIAFIHPLPLAVAGAGVGLSLGTGYVAGISPTSPPTLVADELTEYPAYYREAFLDAYQKEVVRRRVRATRWGGGIGLISGLALLVWGAAELADTDF